MIDSLTPNRLTVRRDEIQAKLDTLDVDARAKLERDMDVTFEEHFAYQNAQARAHLQGVLTTDEAQIVYRALGEVGDPSNGGWAARTDLATKIVVTLTMGELIGR